MRQTEVRGFRPLRWALTPAGTERQWAFFWQKMKKVWFFQSLDPTLSDLWPRKGDLPAPSFNGSAALTQGSFAGGLKVRGFSLDSPAAAAQDWLEYAGANIRFSLPPLAGTVSMLVQPNDAATAGTFRGFITFSNAGLGGSTANFQLHITGANTIAAGWVAASDARVFVAQSGNFDWNAGDRFLLTVTWDPQGTSVYKDSTLLGSNTLFSTGDTASGGAANRIYIGSNQVPASRSLGGFIYYVMVSGSKWSSSMVKQLSFDPFGPLRFDHRRRAGVFVPHKAPHLHNPIFRVKRPRWGYA